MYNLSVKNCKSTSNQFTLLLLIFTALCLGGCRQDELAENIEPTAQIVPTSEVTATKTRMSTVTAVAENAETATVVATPTSLPLATTLPTDNPNPCIPHEATANGNASGSLAIEYWIGSQAYRWQEESNDSQPLTTPTSNMTMVPNSTTSSISPQGDKLVYSVRLDEVSADIFLLDIATNNSSFLAQLSAPESLARNEWASGLELHFNWLDDNRRLLMHMLPVAEGIGNPPYEDLYLLDSQTGSIQVVLPASGAESYLLNAEQTKLFAPVTGTLFIADLHTGTSEEITLPIRDFYDPFVTMTPNQDFLLLSGENGLLKFDIEAKSVQEIDIYFPSIGMGHGSIYPQMTWDESGAIAHLMIPKTTGNHLGNNEIWEPNAEFTYYRFNIETGEVNELATLIGNSIMVYFSPDLTHFIWHRTNYGSTEQSYIYDVRHDTYQLYAEINGISFEGWSPDSHHFLYSEFQGPTIWVGSPCQNIIELKTSGDRTEAYWADNNRFLALGCAEQVNYCTFELISLSDLTSPWPLNIPSDEIVEYVKILGEN